MEAVVERDPRSTPGLRPARPTPASARARSPVPRGTAPGGGGSWRALSAAPTPRTRDTGARAPTVSGRLGPEIAIGPDHEPGEGGGLSRKADGAQVFRRGPGLAGVRRRLDSRGHGRLLGNSGLTIGLGHRVPSRRERDGVELRASGIEDVDSTATALTDVDEAASHGDLGWVSEVQRVRRYRRKTVARYTPPTGSSPGARTMVWNASTPNRANTAVIGARSRSPSRSDLRASRVASGLFNW